MRQTYRPGYFLLPVLEVGGSPAPRRVDGWFGRLEVELECLTPLHVGSGVPERVRLGGRPALVEGFATLPGGSGPELVVPGSSVKGAVRAVVEALTPSCERTRGGCDGRRRDLCPACALLGAPGWRATVSFSDFRAVAGAHRVAAREVAQRYSHREAPAPGRRLYRREPESPLPQRTEVLVVLGPGSRLGGEITLDGATEEGLGLLTVALGLPPRGLPYLRMGGGKNRGLGVVRVRGTGWAGGPGVAAARNPRPGPPPTDRWQERALAAYGELKDRSEAIREEYREP